MANRCIMVMGVGRSRTSVIAGILHHLGVNMGTEFVPADHTNPQGTFEDLELFNKVREVINGQAPATELRPLIDDRDEQPLWGIKDPAQCHVAHHIWPWMASEIRIIVAKRPAYACINSFMEAYLTGRIRAEDWYAKTSAALGARMMEFEGPILDVDTDQLLAFPEREVRRIMHFAFQGLEMPSNLQYLEAVKSVRPKPLRPGPRPWGNLAIGVRIHKHPDPLFFISWSLLLTGGLRPKDTILVPQLYQPAHYAANAIARDFLQTPGYDTLVMLDDDHTFRQNILHQIRENTDTWEYDVISALTVRRDPEDPAPIVLKKNEPPPEPESLKGENFLRYPPIREGQIEPVDAVGLGMTFIRREVMAAMVNKKWGAEWTYDFFRPQDFLFEYGPGIESDDIPFSRRCREMGFRMGVDTKAKIKHVGVVQLGHEDYKEKIRAATDPG